MNYQKLFNIGEDTGEYRPITNFELSQLRANYYANNDYLTQIINYSKKDKTRSVWAALAATLNNINRA